jgi:hypothetical protein
MLRRTLTLCVAAECGENRFGQYSADNEFGRASCFDCPSNSTTQGRRRALSVDECVCDKGFKRGAGLALGDLLCAAF